MGLLEGLRVLDFESFYELLTGKLPADCLSESWLAFTPGFQVARWRWSAKRVMDIVAAVVISIVALPLALLTALMIKLDSTGPIIYTQERVGLNGGIFRVFKFRSMVHDGASPEGL